MDGGLNEESALAHLKKIYYKLAIKYHPDKNKASDAKLLFQKTGSAYSFLKYKIESGVGQASKKDAGGKEDSSTDDAFTDAYWQAWEEKQDEWAKQWSEERSDLIRGFDEHVKPAVTKVYTGFNNSPELKLSWSTFVDDSVSSWDSIEKVSTLSALSFGGIFTATKYNGECRNYDDFLSTCMTKDSDGRIYANDIGFGKGHVVVCFSDVPMMRFAKGKAEYNPALGSEAIAGEIEEFLGTDLSVLNSTLPFEDSDPECDMLKEISEGLLFMISHRIKRNLNHKNLVESVMHQPADHDSFQVIFDCCEKVESVLGKIEERLEALQNRGNKNYDPGMEYALRVEMIGKLRGVKDNSKQLVRRLNSIKTLCKHAIQQSPSQTLQRGGGAKSP